MRYVGGVAVAVAFLSLMQGCVEVIMWAMEPAKEDLSRFNAYYCLMQTGSIRRMK